MTIMSIKKTMTTKWIMSVDLVWWNTVKHATTVSVEPCEAGRNNPSRRHASIRLRTTIEVRQDK